VFEQLWLPQLGEIGLEAYRLIASQKTSCEVKGQGEATQFHGNGLELGDVGADTGAGA
jgi:hypothetical protein